MGEGARAISCRRPTLPAGTPCPCVVRGLTACLGAERREGLGVGLRHAWPLLEAGPAYPRWLLRDAGREPAQRGLPVQVPEARKGRGSTMSAPWPEPDRWYPMIGSEPCAGSILDRAAERARASTSRDPTCASARRASKRRKGRATGTDARYPTGGRPVPLLVEERYRSCRTPVPTRRSTQAKYSVPKQPSPRTASAFGLDLATLLPLLVCGRPAGCTSASPLTASIPYRYHFTVNTKITKMKVK